MLEGKRILLTGVATDDSIALAVGRRAQQLGAEIIAAVFPRDREVAAEALASLPKPPVAIVDADLTDPAHLDHLTAELRATWNGLDGALHAVAFAPKTALEGPFLDTPSRDVELAFRTSAHSYAGLAGVLAELAPRAGGSLVGLDFDGAVAWPVYNWMGVCKSALESVNRYVARDLGSSRIRSNLVAAGPLHTRAADAIPGFHRLLDAWEEQAPLTWVPTDPEPVADAVCFLLSDFGRAVTGEILHVDGGFHATATRLATGS